MQKRLYQSKKWLLYLLLLLIAAVVLLFCMRRILLLRWLISKQDYSSFRLESIQMPSDHYITCSFETKKPDDVLAESLVLRQELEQLLKDHADLYGDYLLEFTFSTDSASGYIRYANFDKLTGACTEPRSSLSYGMFNGRLGSLGAFRDASPFAYLRFVDFQALDDFSVFDTQMNLKMIEFHSCQISDEMLEDLQQKHPECVVVY